jgi:hypothetical protein
VCHDRGGTCVGIQSQPHVVESWLVGTRRNKRCNINHLGEVVSIIICRTLWLKCMQLLGGMLTDYHASQRSISDGVKSSAGHRSDLGARITRLLLQLGCFLSTHPARLHKTSHGSTPRE